MIADDGFMVKYDYELLEVNIYIYMNIYMPSY